MAHPTFDISGRRALVTGSSRGIGRALAKGLIEAGCEVVMHGRDEAGVARAAAALGVRHVAFDVTDAAVIERGIAAAGPLDVLVNNAGIQHRAPLLELDAADWRRVVDTNLTSAFLVARAAAGGMVERGSGKIVNVASLQSELARPGIGAYAAAKGGLRMLTRAMCAEWGPAGVQANAIGPGYFRTDLTRELVADEAFDAWVRRRAPAGRWGRVEELVGALLFLSSPASDYVCGQVLYVDGGMTAVVGAGAPWLRLTAGRSAELERRPRAVRVEAGGGLAVDAVTVEVHGRIGIRLGDDGSQSAQETSCHGVDPSIGEDSYADVIGSRHGDCNKLVTISLLLTSLHQSV